MPRSGLTSRLKQLRALREPPDLHSRDEAETSRNLCIPGFSRIGDYTHYRRELIETAGPPVSLSGLLLSAAQDPEELLFFDLETSGLSSGAGTLAFLAGFGCFRGGAFLLEQFFLSDYPGEAEFLEKIRERLVQAPYFVSYNGRSFDASLLKTRGILHGIKFNFSRHLDLLYISRRLWRDALGSCSLGNIERHILRLERDGDLPGREVPERWFSFLRSADPRLLEDIFRHHRQDILSLAMLWKRLEELFLDPFSHESRGDADPRALGLHLISRGDERGEELLRLAWHKGDFRAGRLLALQYKRRGKTDSALDLWLSMASGADPGVYEELAKYYEHQTGDYEAALRWATLGMGAAVRGTASETRIREFRRRIRRLERKIQGQA